MGAIVNSGEPISRGKSPRNLGIAPADEVFLLIQF